MSVAKCTVLVALCALLCCALAPHVQAASGTQGGVSWQWRFLDATPSSNNGGAAFPHQLGVADRDQRDRSGDRFVPAIRYAHCAVALHERMIITHGSLEALSIRDARHAASK
jgi:hypothetical protein